MRAGACWVVPFWLLPLMFLTAGLAACSSSAEEPPFPASYSPSPSPSRLDPVISRVKGEADNIAQYENSIVGLRIRFDAAAYSVYDDPAEMPPQMRFPDSEATVQMKGIMRNGSMWIIVIPTPMNHSPEEIADAYGEAGVEMAKLMAEGNGYGGGLDLGPAKVVRQDKHRWSACHDRGAPWNRNAHGHADPCPVHRGGRQEVHVSDSAAGRREQLRGGVPASRQDARRCHDLGWRRGLRRRRP